VYTSKLAGVEGFHSLVPKRLSRTLYDNVGDVRAATGAVQTKVAEIASCDTSSGLLGVSDGPDNGVRRRGLADSPHDRWLLPAATVTSIGTPVVRPTSS
jgi:hypothetical protein